MALTTSARDSYGVNSEMPNYAYECPKCGRTKHDLRPMSESDYRPNCPFCETVQMDKLLGGSFQFTWGREDFHGPTVRERQERQIAEAKSMGIEAVPVGYRDYSGPSK